MNARPHGFRSLRGVAILAALVTSACAFSQPTQRPWLPGSYDFQVALPGTAIIGTIEVTPGGPMSVTTSMGDCPARLSQSFRPWHDVRSFDCAAGLLVVRKGTLVGPPITGAISRSRSEPRSEMIETCVRYEPTPEGGRTCAEWHQEYRTVMVADGQSARIWLLDRADDGGR